jgi:hypothetical protein
MKVSELFETSLVEGFAIKLKSGSWYSEERPSLGPLKGGNAAVRVFKSMSAADDFLVMQQNGKFGGKKFEDAEIKRYNPKKLKEGFEAELTDAIKLNWMSWSISEIVKLLKKQIATGKWPELKGKSDDLLHDYVDMAKDDARNQVDEARSPKGMWVIKNKDGVEKRFKDDESPEAKAWKSSNTAKRPSAVPKEKFSKEWWQYQEDNDKTFEKIMPWTKIDKYDLDSASLKDAFQAAGWKEKNVDDWSVIGRGTEINIKGVPCAAVEIRVVYVFTKDDDMGIEGDEPVSDSGSFFAARSPKDPKKYIFARHGN